MQSFFEELGELCRTGTIDFSCCLKKLSDRKLYFIENIISRYKDGENLKVIWEKAVKSNCPFYIGSETKNMLLSFSEILGKGTREDFCKRCADFSSAFEKAVITEERNREKNRSLPVYAGVLTAAALFFILI